MIVINFKDNDFSDTFIAVAKITKEYFSWHEGKIPISKEELVTKINDIIPVIGNLYQNGCDIILKTDDVLIGEEAVAFFNENKTQNLNSEVLYMDNNNVHIL
jgi:hypothetical protein